MKAYYNEFDPNAAQWLRNLIDAGHIAAGEYAEAVEADVQQAVAYGIQGVPFYVIDGKYGISGAQPAESFAGALEQALSER